MRAVVQRVSWAKVLIDLKKTASINKGFLVLLGVGKDDKEADVDFMAKKIANLRVMSDKEGRMNMSLADASASVLVVSQFTLYGDVKKGNRPSFIKAAFPKKARKFYNLFLKKLESFGLKVKSGVFQAYMQVELCNDGPVTIIIES
jgi:D-aminoacyl-tRNA deacylase